MYCARCQRPMSLGPSAGPRTVESQHCPSCRRLVEIREIRSGFDLRYDCEAFEPPRQTIQGQPRRAG